MIIDSTSFYLSLTTLLTASGFLRKQSSRVTKLISRLENLEKGYEKLEIDSKVQDHALAEMKVTQQQILTTMESMSKSLDRIENIFIDNYKKNG